MIEVNEQMLLQRAEAVQEKCEAYKTLIFANEIFKNKSKAYLAALKVQSKKASDVAAETHAMASQAWQDYIAIEMETLKKAGIAKMELEGAQARFEAMRSALSSRKAEVRSFG
jgi:phosphohistidine phosphatase SixA